MTTKKFKYVCVDCKGSNLYFNELEGFAHWDAEKQEWNFDNAQTAGDPICEDCCEAGRTEDYETVEFESVEMVDT